jgi:hypothetical protein
LPRETNEQGKERKIWLPEGLVMPAVHGGQVVKLKIRRPDPVTPWGDVRKYWEVRGGANHLFHVYGNPAFRVWVLVETERDAALVWQFVHDLGIGALGNGGARKRPGGYVADILDRAWLILNALDFDQAGMQCSCGFWEKEYPISKRWPAPPSMGKDVGDAQAAGLDVRQWVLEGIPNHVRRRMDKLSRPVGESGQVAAVPEVQGEKQPSNNTAQSPENKVCGVAPQRSYFDQVLEMMENMPLWRDELVEFRKALSESRFKLFMGANGRPWVGVSTGVDLSDKGVRGQLGAARERFHGMRVLDEWMGENSLEDIVLTYFEGKLEVRG